MDLFLNMGRGFTNKKCREPQEAGVEEETGFSKDYAGSNMSSKKDFRLLT